MLDFQNLTEQQKEFFTTLWEQHAQQQEQSDDSVQAFQCYIEKHRQQEDNQAKAAEALKAKMV